MVKSILRALVGFVLIPPVAILSFIFAMVWVFLTVGEWFYSKNTLVEVLINQWEAISAMRIY